MQPLCEVDMKLWNKFLSSSINEKTAPDLAWEQDKGWVLERLADGKITILYFLSLSHLT